MTDDRWRPAFPARPEALDRHHLDLVAEVGRAFRQGLDHALHAPGPGPVVLGEVQNAHEPWCNLGCSERPLGLYSSGGSGNFTRDPNRCQPEEAIGYAAMATPCVQEVR